MPNFTSMADESLNLLLLNLFCDLMAGFEEEVYEAVLEKGDPAFVDMMKSLKHYSIGFEDNGEVRLVYDKRKESHGFDKEV